MADRDIPIDDIPDAVLRVGRDGTILAVNAAALEMFGYERDELIGRKIELLVPRRYGDHAKTRQAYHDNPQTRPMGKVQQICGRRKDGSEVPVDISLKTAPAVDETVCFVRDISEHVRLSDEIRETAYRDMTTSALNRRAFYEDLSTSLAAHRADGEGLAIAVFDLDHFKDVNDSLGHKSGDEILVEFCLRVKQIVPEGLRFYRLGGDEFALIMPECPGHEAANALIDAVLSANRRPYSVGGHRIAIGCSVGIVHAPTDGNTVDELVANADLALYQSKATRGSASVYSPHLRHAVEERFAMLSELGTAGEEGQFELYFQPKVDIHTEAIVGAEALLRWVHPKRGLLAPAQFIDVLTDSDLSVAVGRWTLFEACRQAAEWRKQSDRIVSVAVNLFPWQVKARTFHDDIVAALNDAKLDAGRLELELTENTIVESSADFIEMLAAVRAMGVCIALDDFGTGFASLNSLTRFPIDMIKIDRSFVREVGTGRGNWPVLRAMPKLARDLGLQSVAEGVETVEDAMMVRHFGYDYGQGYYWGKPMSAPEFAKRISGNAPSAGSGTDNATYRPIRISAIEEIVKRRFPMYG
ncbi:MAG: hypothetical protein CL534_18685 [Ahrensia sp.]|nr:hypothetical protein [Ahrensia sp.]